MVDKTTHSKSQVMAVVVGYSFYAIAEILELSSSVQMSDIEWIGASKRAAS